MHFVLFSVNDSHEDGSVTLLEILFHKAQFNLLDNWIIKDKFDILVSI